MTGLKLYAVTPLAWQRNTKSSLYVPAGCVVLPPTAPRLLFTTVATFRETPAICHQFLLLFHRITSPVELNAIRLPLQLDPSLRVPVNIIPRPTLLSCPARIFRLTLMSRVTVASRPTLLSLSTLMLRTRLSPAGLT